MIKSSFATPMTREGVNCPSKLSRDGQEAHYKRRGGPGSMRGKPYLQPVTPKVR